jgi:hypothetical protein
MAKDNTSFLLSEQQIKKLNQYFSEQSAAYAAEGENPWGVRVVFEWTPLGRCVTAYFDSAINGCEIEEL